MRRLRSILRAPAALLAVSAIFSACSESPSSPPVEYTVTASPAAVTLDPGETQAITATVSPALPNAVFLYRSAEPAVASVDDDGVITAIAPGTSLITARLASDTTLRGFVAVTVTGVPEETQRLTTLGLGAVTERYTSEVAVRGDWAYTSTWGNREGRGGNIVKVWNVAGNVPVLRDSLLVQGTGTTGDVQISDDGALLVVAAENGTAGSIVIYDRSNPALPVQVARFQNANTAPGVHTVKLGRTGGRHYAFLSVNPGVQGARLVIVDITNPAAPTQVFTQVMGAPFIHDVFVRDGILFTALWHDGFRIYDIGGGNRGGTAAAPVLMGQLDMTAGFIHNIWWFHDPATGAKKYLFVGEENAGSPFNGTASGDIHVIDVSNMSAPVQVAQFGVQGAGTHNFSMDEASGVLYAAYYNGGVRAIDVRGDLGACTAAQRNTLGFCDLRAMGREMAVGLTTGYVWGVAWQGNHVYASDMLAGLYKLDVAGLRR